MINPILVALDVPSVEEALRLRSRIGDSVGGMKLGLEFFTACGPDAVRAATADRGGLEFFLDLKLHDIPNTVAQAMRAAAALSPTFVTLHATGGRAMLEAANEQKASTKTLAVTILTSMDDDDLAAVGLPKAADAVAMLARLAADAGCDGVICAPTEIDVVRAVCPSPFLIVTPGIRQAEAVIHDQARTRTPAQAINAGADRLVIGRPITGAADPRAAALEILQTLEREAP